MPRSFCIAYARGARVLAAVPNPGQPRRACQRSVGDLMTVDTSVRWLPSGPTLLSPERPANVNSTVVAAGAAKARKVARSRHVREDDHGTLRLETGACR